MFSTRYLAIFALIAAASALPATEKPIPQPITSITEQDFAPVAAHPWYNVPYFGDITKIFAPLWKLFPNFEDLGPRIFADDHKFQVIVPVKDYNKNDLKVKVKGDFIFVEGIHETKEADHDLFSSQFFHTYTMPANSSAADVTAELTSDGNLVVTAPISSGASKSNEANRDVPIVETGAPSKKDEPTVTSKAPEKTPEISTNEPEIVSEEDRREPTTPQSEREEATEKDNEILHGNDINP